jgi:hypothetical protein
MAGPPINFYGSDTYHMSTIIGTYEYILYTADMKFLASNWASITLAMDFITAKIDSTGLIYVTGTSDWGRVNNKGGRSTVGNAYLYQALTTASLMANWINDSNSATKWTSQAATIKAAVNNEALNWDPKVGAFKDSDVDSSIYPEDGNSLALFYNMASPAYHQNISNHFLTTWGPLGAVCPEMEDNISPFVESMEIKAHLTARQPLRALELMRRSWGWYLNSPYGTGSTCIEGYLKDGTFGYRRDAGYEGDTSYTSHAHGWSTGPTSALSTMVLGLQMVSPGGKKWMLQPQFGDLKWVEGGYTTPLGKFSASWKRMDNGYAVGFDVPKGASGTLVLPFESMSLSSITIDGRPFTEFTHDTITDTITITNQIGGKHKVIVWY